ncbi:hypothetical protein ABZ851_32810 [Streptomyces sp. NPDC047049]|uniref:hypothetical protein n=1 Tax=Streptomyces sp. NPDC047049 TaxID=3156688 RepID=UPI0033E87ADB
MINTPLERCRILDEAPEILRNIGRRPRGSGIGTGQNLLADPEADVMLDLIRSLLDLPANAAHGGDTVALLAPLARALYHCARLGQLLRRTGPRRTRRVVEPLMTFITPGVAAAGIKATGSVTSALIGRYRPTGVPRLGSKEERREAYVRLLDSSARAFGYGYQMAHLSREAGRAADKLLLGQLPRVWEITSDLIGALNGVQLCGSLPVIAAAEALVTAISDLELNESAARFQQQSAAVVAAREAFLDACREDLAYTTRWWQIRRRLGERRFLRRQQTGR